MHHMRYLCSIQLHSENKNSLQINKWVLDQILLWSVAENIHSANRCVMTVYNKTKSNICTVCIYILQFMVFSLF